MIPRWCYDAAIEIYNRLETISAEAEQSAQVARDSNVEREEFTTALAVIIEAHFRGLKGPQCTCHQPTRFGHCPVHEANR